MIKKILPIIFIIFVWLIFSKPFLIDKKIPVPADFAVNHFSIWSSYEEFWGPIKNPAQPDVINQIIPWKKLSIESMKNLQVPHWNPYSFSGTPHLSNYQSSPFSSTNVFYFLLDLNIAWSFAVLIQPLFAGIFTYLFARSLKRSKPASIISAISFMFCGFITTWMSYTTLSLAISFLPLALFSIEKYYSSKQFRYLILLSSTIPLSFFSGHFQTSLYFLIFVFLYILFKFINTKDTRSFLHAIIFSTFGIFISLPQILPTIDLYSSSVRSSIFQKVQAFPLKYFTTIIAPDYYGNPVTRNNYFGSYAEWSIFFGTIPLFLSIYSFFKRNNYVFFFFFMGALSILFSLDTIFLDFIIKLKIPVLSTSAVSRILVLFSFSFSILAAFGFDQLIKDITKKNYKRILAWFSFSFILIILIWIFTIGKLIDPVNYQISLKNLILPSLLFLGLVISILMGILNKKLISISIIIIIFLTVFDLLRFSMKWQVFSDPNDFFPTTPIISKMQSLDNNYRTLGKFGAEGSVYYGIPSTEGYDPLYINRYGEFIASLDNGNIKSSPRSGVSFDTNDTYSPKVFDLLGIKYVLEKKLDVDKVWSFPFKKYPDKFDLIYEEDEFFIYENKEVIPKAFLIGEYEEIKSDQKIIDKILDEDFDLRNSVVLEKDPGIRKSKELNGTVEILEYSPNKVVIKTSANKDSILFLNDNFYPGWKVKVNGDKKEILRANYTFRAVPIEKGDNEVIFYFESKPFNNGVLLATLSIILILIILASRWYTKRNINHVRR